MTFDPETDLRIDRLIPATPEAIWRCWEDPDLFRQWFVPPPVQVTHVQNDLCAGGRAFNVMRLPDGTDLHNDGCFLLAERATRLVFSDAMLPGFRPAPQGFMVADIRLIPQEGGTLYAAHVMHQTAAQRAEHERMGFLEGWGTTLDQLAALAPKM